MLYDPFRHFLTLLYTFSHLISVLLSLLDRHQSHTEQLFITFLLLIVLYRIYLLYNQTSFQMH